MHLGLPTQAVAVFMLTVVLLILASDSDLDWFEVGDSVFVSELRLADLSANGGLGGMLPGRVDLRGAVGRPGEVLFDGTFTIPRLGGTVPSAACRGPYPMRFHARSVASVPSGRMSPGYVDGQRCV